MPPRVWRRCRALGLGTLEAYLAVLQADAGELVQLQHGLLVSVSAFFRDGEVFDVLPPALKPLVAARGPEDALRVWVPACATGEEAYGWTGEAVGMIEDRLRGLKLRVPVKGVRARLIPSALELEECRSFGRDLARQLAGTHDKQIIDMAALA